MHISETVRAENKALHEKNPSYGSKGCQWSHYLDELIRADGHNSILDYGAGKGSLAASLGELGYLVQEYDPAIPGKDRAPMPADLVVCTDVLEHVEPDLIDDVLFHLFRMAKRKLFFDVCTEPAAKTLSDGRNAHLLVRPAAWWKEKISERFDVVYWRERPELNFIYGEAVPKGVVLPPVSARKKLSPEMSAFFDLLRRDMSKNVDAMSRIDSMSVYQGVEDVNADLQVVYDNLDNVDDPQEIIAEACKLARKMLMIRVDAKLGKEHWIKVLEQRLRIVQWQEDDGKFYIGAAPRIGVAGVNIVAAGTDEQRWTQVEANAKRIGKRIVPKHAHGRKAIIACYGPSLRETIGLLKKEAADAMTDVFSVSGAHDFLIENGCVPSYHVECDPRAHKADNIDIAHPAVKYLIGSCVHPSFLDKLEGQDVSLWHVASDEHTIRIVNELGEPGTYLISGGGSVGVRSISLLYNLGYRKFSIYGMDCSFADDGKAQWAGKHGGKKQTVVTARIGDETFHTSPILLTYATDFLELIQKVDVECQLIGNGFLSHLVREHASRGQRQ